MFNRFKRRAERTTILADAPEQSRVANYYLSESTPDRLRRFIHSSIGEQWFKSDCAEKLDSTEFSRAFLEWLSKMHTESAYRAIVSTLSVDDYDNLFYEARSMAIRYYGWPDPSPYEASAHALADSALTSSMRSFHTYYPSIEVDADTTPRCTLCHAPMTETTQHGGPVRIFTCFVCVEALKQATPIPRCAACNEPIPNDARHCIGCGAAVANTGKTERLG